MPPSLARVTGPRSKSMNVFFGTETRFAGVGRWNPNSQMRSNQTQSTPRRDAEHAENASASQEHATVLFQPTAM